MGDAIVRRARGGHQRPELDEGVDRHEDGTEGERGTCHAIGHPHRNRGRALIVLAQPDLATMSNGALNENRPAMQRMPRIVNGDFFSVMGRM